MSQFRKKPVVIEAVLWTGSNQRDVLHFIYPDMSENGLRGAEVMNLPVVIETLEGDLTATPGDWIIRGVQGEFYPCKPDIFEQTYESSSVPVLETPREGMKGHAEVFVADDGERAIKWVVEDDHEECDKLIAALRIEIAELHGRVETPSAPRLEWVEPDDHRRLWSWKSGLWDIVPASHISKGVWLRHGDSYLKHCESVDAAKLLAEKLDAVLWAPKGTK